MFIFVRLYISVSMCEFHLQFFFKHNKRLHKNGGVESQSPGVWILARSLSRSVSFEGDYDSAHVGLLVLVHCTLSGFGRVVSFLPVVLPQACPVVTPLCLLVYTIVRLLEECRISLRSSLSTQSVCQILESESESHKNKDCASLVTQEHC